MDISQISLDTFKSLVEEKVAENRKIEFKNYQFPEGKVSAEQKEKLEKEIAAFANADGGIIFIGIDENKEKVASRIIGVGCGIEKFDEIQLSIQSRLLAKVHPRIYGISMDCFKYSDSDMVMTIKVPKSISRPHAVNDGNKDNFYIRHSNGITNMSLDDLRREILAGASYQSDIKRLRQERLGMIMSNEYVRPLQDGAKLILHIVPLWSLEFGNAIDITKLNRYRGKDPFKPISGGSYGVAYCADGEFKYSIPHNKSYVESCVMVMRTGILEAIDVRMMNLLPEEKGVYQWCEIEKQIYKKLNDYSSVLEELDIPKPWYISFAIVNGKGYWTTSYGQDSEELYSNYIQATDVVLNDGQEIKDIIKPAFDSLANAFGYAETFFDLK